ncbi:MAG: 30S ribosomal protein S12 methylthiotransferase RimO, partial [Bacteroidales bacterium]|nr:30S ribosomal protein S12 methylthiotransferase RimO [Bacteroidales bacterium]
GTYGALHLKDTVPQKVKRERYARLMELQKGISFAYNQSRVGNSCNVLADYLISEDTNNRVTVLGRTQYEAPEVDGQIILENAPEVVPGTFVTALITKADEYDLYARLIKE